MGGGGGGGVVVGGPLHHLLLQPEVLQVERLELPLDLVEERGEVGGGGVGEHRVPGGEEEKE